MSIRDMKGNPRILEQQSWSGMSSEGQAQWTVPGWQQSRWDKKALTRVE